MHSWHRDLKSKHARVERDLYDAQQLKDKFEQLYNEKLGENILAQQEILKEKTGCASIEEIISSQARELEVKAK